MDFKEEVYKIVKGIPKGKTLSYKEVAEGAERPRAWRSVGNILNKNYNLSIPCHRVIKSSGEIGGYNRGAGKKKRLLEKERGLE